jgi:hypothetical protein
VQAREIAEMKIGSGVHAGLNYLRIRTNDGLLEI